MDYDFLVWICISVRSDIWYQTTILQERVHAHDLSKGYQILATHSFCARYLLVYSLLKRPLQFTESKKPNSS